MKLSAENLQFLADVAVDAAVQSGQYIRSRFHDEVEVSDKDSGSCLASQVVTEVDFRSQSIILKILTPTIRDYDLGILAEESDDDGSRLVKDYFWCVDPLDGTLSFIEKKPGFAVSIALVSRSGIPFIGVVYDPVTETVYRAVKDSGCRRNGKTFFLNSAESEIRHVSDSGAVMNACRVLEQAPACFVKKPKKEEGGGCFWDYAATACIFKELKAHVSDASGDPLNLNNEDTIYMNTKGVVFASDKNIGFKCLQLLKH